MSSQELEDEARAFLEQYSQAFDSIDGERIAALYHEPCITLRGDGSIHCLRSREELARFFQTVAETYQRDGYRSGRFSNLETRSIGGKSALVTVDWELLRQDGSTLRQWRQSYNLVRVGNVWQILVSTFHVS
jgi:ketosteroid isomerase-like protein